MPAESRAGACAGDWARFRWCRCPLSRARCSEAAIRLTARSGHSVLRHYTLLFASGRPPETRHSSTAHRALIPPLRGAINHYRFVVWYRNEDWPQPALSILRQREEVQTLSREPHGEASRFRESLRATVNHSLQKHETSPGGGRCFGSLVRHRHHSHRFQRGAVFLLLRSAAGWARCHAHADHE